MNRAHETKSCVAATRYCNPCQKYTLHNFHDGRKGACQECAAKLEVAHSAPKQEKAAEQQEMFGGVGGAIAGMGKSGSADGSNVPNEEV